MLSKLILSASFAVLLAAPAQADDDPVAKAEALLKNWRDSDTDPSCANFRTIIPPIGGIEIDVADPGAKTPKLKRLLAGPQWKQVCGEHLLPLVGEGLFKAPPFCKALDATRARCTLMTSTSLPLVLIFEVSRASLHGVILQRIEWQRKTGQPLPQDDDDDDLPM